MTTWGDVLAHQQGTKLIRHAVLTYNGTWGAGLVQYPGDVVNGIAEYVSDDLLFEIPCPYPASFGFIGGATDAPSYDQSVQDALNWTAVWLAASGAQSFFVVGYSQGAEAAARVAMELESGLLSNYKDRFMGGVTFGNPARGSGFHAATIADPGGHGIATNRMTSLPTRGGQVVWADYVHSRNNGDQSDDMYACVPDGKVGDDMSAIYQIATEAQLNDAVEFAKQFAGGVVTCLGDILGAPIDAIEAAWRGLEFVAAPGGPTAPHISYLGEIAGYSNLVAHAVGFVAALAQATPARST
jgi:hypothetical protein